MFVSTRGSYPHFCSSAFPWALFPVNKKPTLHAWFNPDTCPAAQLWPSGSFSSVVGDPNYACLSLFMLLEAQKSLAFCLLLTWWYCQTICHTWLFKITLHGPQFTFTGVWASNVQLLLKWPVVWNDWSLKPYETNTFLVVLSTHIKWAQIGCKFNPDLQNSAKVLVNLIQPSGLFHPVSGFTVKVSLCPTCCPNKRCLKQNEDISKNEELFREQCFSLIPYVRTCIDKQYAYNYCR